MNEGVPSKAYYLPAGGIELQDGEFEELIDEKMQEENAEFEQFKTEMHDAQFDAKITVGKKLTDSNGRPLGKQVFECFECGLEDYTFSQLCTRIREDFGTGLYKIQGRDSKGKYKFNKTVGILAPNKTDNVPAGNDVGSLIDKFSDAMQRQQMRTEAMFKDLMGPRSGGDAFDQMTKMATAMGSMMGAMGIQRPEIVAPKTLIEQITEAKMLMEFVGGGDASGEANLYTLLTATMQSFGGPIAAALAAGQADGTVDAQGLLAAPNPSDTPRPKLTPEQEQEKKKQAADMEALKGQINLLIVNANAGVEAETMANLLVEKTPEDKLDNLFNFLSSDNWFEQIVLIVPEAKAHENWFTIMRDTVINLLTEPEDEPIVHESDESTGAGSDAETVAGDTDSAIESDGDTSKNT